MLQHAWTLNTLSQSQIIWSWKDIVWFYLYVVPRVIQFKETEHRMVVVRAWREENGQLECNGHGVSVLWDENVLKMDGGDVCTTMWMCLMPLLKGDIYVKYILPYKKIYPPQNKWARREAALLAVATSPEDKETQCVKHQRGMWLPRVSVGSRETFTHPRDPKKQITWKSVR